MVLDPFTALRVALALAKSKTEGPWTLLQAIAVETDIDELCSVSFRYLSQEAYALLLMQKDDLFIPLTRQTGNERWPRESNKHYNIKIQSANLTFQNLDNSAVAPGWVRQLTRFVWNRILTNFQVAWDSILGHWSLLRGNWMTITVMYWAHQEEHHKISSAYLTSIATQRSSNYTQT